MFNTEVLKRKLESVIVGARSLVWIGRQPSKLDVPGSNPGAPATISYRAFCSRHLKSTQETYHKSSLLLEGTDILEVHGASSDSQDNHNSILS